MACKVSEWYKNLDQTDRKDLINTMFALLPFVDKLDDPKSGELFLKFVMIFDDEYHSLKDERKPCDSCACSKLKECERNINGNDGID